MPEVAERDRIMSLIQEQGQVEIEGGVNYSNAASFSYISHDGSYLVTVTRGTAEIVGDPIKVDSSSKVEPKPEPKPETKNEIKPDIKAEVKTEVKPEAKVSFTKDATTKDATTEESSSSARTSRNSGRIVK